MSDNIPFLLEIKNFHGPAVNFRFSLNQTDSAAPFHDGGVGLALASYNPFNADQVPTGGFAFIKSAMSHWKTALSIKKSSGIIAPDLQIFGDHIKIGDKVIYDGDILSFDGAGKISRVENIAQLPTPNTPTSENDRVINHDASVKVGCIISSADLVVEAYAAGAQLNSLFRVEDMFLGEKQILLRNYLVEKDPNALAGIKRFIQENFEAYFEALKTIPEPFETYIRLLDIPMKDWPEQYLSEIRHTHAAIFNERGEPVSGGPLAMLEPELYQLQIDAILEAAERTGHVTPLFIGLPNVTNAPQVELLSAMVNCGKENAGTRALKVGVYIHDETTALSIDGADARKIAPLISAISMGASDMTADVTGISRNNLAGNKQYAVTHGIDYNIYTKLAPEVEAVIADRTMKWREFNPGIRLLCCSWHILGSMSEFCNMGYEVLGLPVENVSMIIGELAKVRPSRDARMAAQAITPNAHRAKHVPG